MSKVRPWQGHRNTRSSARQTSSQGRWVHIADIPITCWPRRTTNAPIAPATTRRGTPSTSSLTWIPLAAQRPRAALGSRTSRLGLAGRLPSAGWPSRLRPVRRSRNAPPTVPTARLNPAASASRRDTTRSGGAPEATIWANLRRNAGDMRGWLSREPARRAPITIASRSAASEGEALRRRPARTLAISRSRRSAARSSSGLRLLIARHLGRGAKRPQLHHLDPAHRGPQLPRHLLQGVATQEPQLEQLAVVRRQPIQDPLHPLHRPGGVGLPRLDPEVLAQLLLGQPEARRPEGGQHRARGREQVGPDRVRARPGAQPRDRPDGDLLGQVRGVGSVAHPGEHVGVHQLQVLEGEVQHVAWLGETDDLPLRRGGLSLPIGPPVHLVIWPSPRTPDP